MRRRSAASGGNRLRASQMHRRFARYPGSETKTDAAVMASLVGHRAQRVALGMIAGSAAGPPGRSGGGNNYDAHGFILAVSSAVPTRPRVRLQIRTSNCL